MSLNHFVFFCFLLFLFSCGQPSEPETASKAPIENTAAPEKSETKKKNIIFFGNSLTAAYGLDPSEGFVSLIQQRLDSLGLSYRAINAGLSGETTAGGKERVSWVLRTPVDIFVLELGGNDALRGVAPSSSKKNLAAIIEAVKDKNPDAKIILAGMQAPPNLGEKYTSEFRNMYAELAESYSTEIIPFFLEGVGGVPDLNQKDRIHPNEAGQLILVENVWAVLKNIL